MTKEDKKQRAIEAMAKKLFLLFGGSFKGGKLSDKPKYYWRQKSLKILSLPELREYYEEVLGK